MDIDKLRPKIIWFSIFMVPLILLFVLMQAAKTQATASPSAEMNMMLLYIAAAVCLLIGLVSQPYLMALFKKGGVDSNAKNNPFMLSMIVSMAFLEFVALLGFIPANQMHDPNVYYPFMIVALVAMLYRFPTDFKIENGMS